jgi:hypothetical protein
LTQTAFSNGEPLKPIDAPSRPKGWRAMPLSAGGSSDAFGAQIVAGQAAVGLHSAVIAMPVAIKQGDVALLAQEVRSPFAGTYTLRVRVRGEAPSEEEFGRWFQRHFACRLQMFEYTETAKNAANRKELAAIDVRPAFAASDDTFETFELTKEFINASPGANFSFGIGMGIAVVVEKKSAGILELAPGTSPLARLRVADVQLDFVGKPLNEKVKV